MYTYDSEGNEGGGGSSPEQILEQMGSIVDNDSIYIDEKSSQTWFFAYDNLLVQTTISRFIKGMNTGKVVSAPHYLMTWPYYLPPRETALPSLERTDNPENVVWGFLYEATNKKFIELERYLKVPQRYRRMALQVIDRGGRRFPAFTYVLAVSSDDPMKPSRSYINEIVEAAMERGLPDEWIEHLKSIKTEG